MGASGFNLGKRASSPELYTLIRDKFICNHSRPVVDVETGGLLAHYGIPGETLNLID